MSKIGKKPIVLPAGVTVSVADGMVTVQGPKGQAQHELMSNLSVVVEDNKVQIQPDNARDFRPQHGLIRALINNMVQGVSAGFTRRLQLVGTGYRVAKKGTGLNLTVGFSHPVEVSPLPGITLDVEGNNIIIVSGTDKQVVGQMAANIRRVRPPEPYKGKGIRYEDEVVRRKQGKAVAK